MAHFIIQSVLNVIDLFAVRRKKSVLLLRLDQIGDYVLFRNFIEILREDLKFKEYEITLCGNIIWKDLSEALDSRYINRYIWIDKKKVNESKLYWWFLLLKIHLYKYEMLVNPTYSRTEFEEEVASHFKADEKTGSSGDLTNLGVEKKNEYDRRFTRLIKTNEVPEFEFIRNKEFFENILGYRLQIKKPKISLEGLRSGKISSLKQKYILIVPFAGQLFRIWHGSNFQKIIEFILANYDYDIVISGNLSDREKIGDLVSNLSGRVHNFAGETTLPELCLLIDKSELLLTHDTSALHIAAAVNKPVICISNGNYYGRFVPYPPEIDNKIELILPEKINQGEGLKALREKFKGGSKLDINAITVESVKKRIEMVIQMNNSINNKIIGQ